MKAKVPGASSSTGVKAIDFTLPAGDYVFEIGQPEVKEAKSPCLVHTFPMVVIDGPDDEKSGRSTQGRKYTHRIIQLLPEHESYKDNDTRAADEIADLCAAAGVDLDDDGYETDDFAGKTVKAKLAIRTGKDEAGEPRPENTVRQQKGEDGKTHLWLPDDGVPAAPKKKSPSASSGSKKPSASKKR